MSKNKGKPGGKYADTKTAVGRKGERKRSGWPEDAPTQHVQDATANQVGNPLEPEEVLPGDGAGRDRKAGSPF